MFSGYFPFYTLKCPLAFFHFTASDIYFFHFTGLLIFPVLQPRFEHFTLCIFKKALFTALCFTYCPPLIMHRVIQYLLNAHLFVIVHVNFGLIRFTCDLCQDKPDVIICDGTAVALRKRLLKHDTNVALEIQRGKASSTKQKTDGR